jgi:hypothetical protein
MGDYYSTGKISSLNNRVSFAATASVIPGAGAWEIGFCVRNSYSEYSLEDNDYVNGWVGVTNDQL